MNVDRIVVDSWDPGYSAPFDLDEQRDPPAVDPDVELPSGRWRPLDAGAVPAADEVLFVDGVQRVDARVTLIDGPQAMAGMAGSFAAGAVRSAGDSAVIEQVQVRRGLFTRAADVVLECGGGVTYQPYGATDTAADTLVAAMNEQMRSLEKVIAIGARAQLVVLDGPLSGAPALPRAVGLVKTHRQTYLPEALQRVVAALAPGQRTPLFFTTTRFSRHSWYLRLPSGGPHPAGAHPWAGIVRCEVSGSLSASAARQLAETTAATIPRFASSPHRDPRAPQNLTPIGALESRLHHRLGDPTLLERMLRRTCAAWAR